MELVEQYWIAAVVGVGLLGYLLRRLYAGERQFPYAKKPAIMTANERAFYRALIRAVNDNHDIFAMVRIADLLAVQPNTPKRQSWQNRINCKHIDFVLCDGETQQPVLAIEVDDRSHQRRDRQERDYFVDRAFDAAGLPLLRIEATRSYAARDLHAAIQETLNARKNRKLASQRRVVVG